VEEQQLTDTQPEEQGRPRNELGQFAPKVDPVVDDVVQFGTKVDEQSEAFPTGEEKLQVPQDSMRGTPAEDETQPVTPQPQDVNTTDNEEVRYQYWQSQADKAKNDLTSVREQNQLLQNQLNIMNQQTQQTQEQTQEKENTDFPSPPERPQKPRAYNREEAYTDPQSESAQYMDSMEQWRDTMDEYNQLHTQYQTELSRAERMDFIEQQKYQQNLQEAQRQEYNQLNQMADHVRKEYNASDEELREFYQKFSSDDSITLDNLWKLYQMEKGGRTGGPAAPPQGGSPVFEQTKRAQQVAAPMGVASGQSNSQQGSAENQIMDSLIEDYNKNNPW